MRLASDHMAFVLFLVLVIWTVSMFRVLRNKDLNDITRFMWVFIVTMMPLFGGLLYLFMASFGKTPVTLVETAEEEGKRRMLGVYEKTEWENR
jgi:hypothetical protein